MSEEQRSPAIDVLLDRLSNLCSQLSGCLSRSDKLSKIASLIVRIDEVCFILDKTEIPENRLKEVVDRLWEITEKKDYSHFIDAVRSRIVATVTPIQNHFVLLANK